MRICVLQSSYKGSGHILTDIDTIPSDPGAFADQHTVEHRWIQKATAKEQIDAIIEEKFDFFINFMWGLHRDNVAGVEASQYFESFNLPSAGIRSWSMSDSKLDFYRYAQKAGSPRVPGTTKFPLFVKPAFGMGSMHIKEDCLCNNQAEVDAAVARIKKDLAADQQRKIDAGYEVIDSEEIVVQEFVDGPEFLCTVVEMNGYPIPLDPCRMLFKHSESGPQFLTMDVKFNDETHLEILKETDEPDLFRKIQEAAVAAWHALPKHGDFMGIDLDCRIDAQGEVVALEVNPMPVAFLPDETGFADLPVTFSLPGAHRAAINIFIANYFLSQKKSLNVAAKVAETYDWFSEEYDQHTSDMIVNVTNIIAKHDFDGSVLDVACGTGIVGTILKKQGKQSGRLTGIDLSPGMLDKCRKLDIYSELILGRMQDVLAALKGRRIFDHIICTGSLHFLSTCELSLVLSRMFMLADRSVTVMIDSIPDSYNVNLIHRGYPHMYSTNHLDEMVAFGVPWGWKLSDRWSDFGWKSPQTGDRVDMTVFRFDRCVQAVVHQNGQLNGQTNGHVNGHAGQPNGGHH